MPSLILELWPQGSWIWALQALPCRPLGLVIFDVLPGNLSPHRGGPVRKYYLSCGSVAPILGNITQVLLLRSMGQAPAAVWNMESNLIILSPVTNQLCSKDEASVLFIYV